MKKLPILKNVSVVRLCLIYLILFNIYISAEQIYNFTGQNDSVIISGENLQEEESLFFSPINFSTKGLTCFFNHRYNNPKYVEDFLPNNLNDIIQFLEYAKESKQNKNFIKTVFKIFTKKVKFSNYVSAKEIINLSNRLPEFLDVYLMPEAQTASDEYIVKNVLCSEFAENFSDFKMDPNAFLSKLSEKICLSLDKKEKLEEKDITSAELKEILIRFLENALNKCLCDLTNENQDIWQQYKELSQSIYNLKILLHDNDDINDLINSVIARLNYTIDMIGSEVSVETYKTAIDELYTMQFDWLEIEEHDSLMKPKKEELLYMLQNVGLSKALARSQYGFTESD